ncbi:hypothetical protein [Emticicia soli]|uniref:Phage protein n=1 Tax=Emticicia soli TaxID=2027878 RepID=A0ABW5JDN7_9BACT
MRTKKRKIKTYRNVENALDAKHEAARKFIQSIDKSKLKELLTKNP